jgi:hypothetical protein
LLGRTAVFRQRRIVFGRLDVGNEIGRRSFALVRAPRAREATFF